MNVFRATAIVLAALSLAACGETRPGLNGNERDGFIAGIVASCSKDNATLSRAGVAPERVTAYCTCVGDKLADHVSPEMVGDNNALQSAVEPHFKSALAACQSEH